MMKDDLPRALARAAGSADPNLADAALLIARLEYPRLDPGPYLARLDAMGDLARARLERTPEGRAATDPETYAQVAALNEYLFQDEGFTGNREHYEDPRNSFLNEVLERRTGIPITLAVVYMEVARRAGLRVDGVNFPGHFLLRVPAAGRCDIAADLIIDAFHGGALLSEGDCRDLLRRHVGDEATFDAHLLAPATKPQILVRMLLNLKRVYVRMRSFPQARDVTELLLAIDPSALTELRDRGLIAYHLKDFPAALRDLEAYLRLTATSEADEQARQDQQQIWEHVKTLRRRVAALN